MVTTERRLEADADAVRTTPAGARWAIGFASLFFILLQSACTLVMAASGLRFLIGIGSVLVASGLRPLEILHFDALRFPMMILAVGGSLVNLYVIRQIRVLRSRPSSQWRVRPATAGQTRSEAIQVVLAVLTLALVAAEETTHLLLHHRF